MKVKTLQGEVKMKVREGTAANTSIRLAGEGLPDLRGRGKGSLYVKLIPKIPKKLTREQRKAALTLRQAGL